MQTPRASKDRIRRQELHLELAKLALQAVTRLPGRGAGKARTAAKDALRMMVEQDVSRLQVVAATLLARQENEEKYRQACETRPDGMTWFPNQVVTRRFIKV